LHRKPTRLELCDVGDLEIRCERDGARLVEQLPQSLMSRVLQIRGERAFVVNLDRHEKLEVQRRGAVVCGAETDATAHFVAANRRNLGHRALQRLAHRGPIVGAQIGARREEHEVNDHRAFFTSLVPSPRRDGTRSSFGGSAGGMGSGARSGGGGRFGNGLALPNGLSLRNGLRAPNGFGLPDG
jgi:uncharacterized membrane protein YgcG